jgi:hypothetical protein
MGEGDDLAGDVSGDRIWLEALAGGCSQDGDNTHDRDGVRKNQ